MVIVGVVVVVVVIVASVLLIDHRAIRSCRRRRCSWTLSIPVVTKEFSSLVVFRILLLLLLLLLEDDDDDDNDADDDMMCRGPHPPLVSWVQCKCQVSVRRSGTTTTVTTVAAPLVTRTTREIDRVSHG